MRIFNRRSGFTMLELLMVVIIVGVLAALAIPQYANFVEKARISEATNTIGAIKSAESLYKLENSLYIDCADAAAISTNLSVTYPTGYWTYAVSGATATAYTVTATRGAASASAEDLGDTIIYTWADATGGAWGGGTHRFEPA